MAVYVVSYDLRVPGRNYQTLWARLGEWKAQRALESLWLIDTSATAVQIRDDLRLYVDANDRLFVAKLSGESAWISLYPGADELLRQRFTGPT